MFVFLYSFFFVLYRKVHEFSPGARAPFRRHVAREGVITASDNTVEASEGRARRSAVGFDAGRDKPGSLSAHFRQLERRGAGRGRGHEHGTDGLRLVRPVPAIGHVRFKDGGRCTGGA